MSNTKFNDLTGQKFGLLLVVKRSSERSNRGVVWDCMCECGGHKNVASTDLRSGNVKSCGCISKDGLAIGQKLRKSLSIDHVCPSCNIIFKVKPSRLARSSYVCCSVSCREIHLLKNPHKRPMAKNRSALEKFFDEKATRLRASARKRSKDHSNSIDGQFLMELWNKQKGKCFYTKIEMSIDSSDKLRLVSVDRIDNKKGYQEDNIVLCTYAFNSFKFNLSHQEILDFVKMIKDSN